MGSTLTKVIPVHLTYLKSTHLAAASPIIRVGLFGDLGSNSYAGRRLTAAKNTALMATDW